MSFIPNKQYTEGDDLSVSPIGEVVQTRDSVSGLAVPLTLGKEGPDLYTLGTGILGWLKSMADSLGYTVDTGQSIGQALTNLNSTVTTKATPTYTFNSDGSSVAGIALFARENQSQHMFPLQTDGKSLFVTDPSQTVASDPDSKTINSGTYALVAASNESRYRIFLRNDSTGGQTVWFSFSGSAPTVGKGLSLKPTETYEMEFPCTTVVYGWADGDGAKISVQEWSRI